MSSENICFLDKVYSRVLESNTFKPRALKMTDKTNYQELKVSCETILKHCRPLDPANIYNNCLLGI